MYKLSVAHFLVSLAMDTSKGLVVPVIKFVQNKSILDLAVELNQLQVKANSLNLQCNCFIHGFMFGKIYFVFCICFLTECHFVRRLLG